MADKQELPDEAKPLDYQKDIHNVSLEDIFDEVAEDEDAAKHAKPAEPVVETPVETKPVETPPVVEPKKEEPKPAIDEEKLSNKIVTEIVDKLAPADATKEEKKDLKTKIKEMQDKAVAEGRELRYDEALEFIHKETTESVKASLKDEVKQEVLADLAKEVQDEEAKATKAKQDQETYEAERTKAWNTQWDIELTRLENADKMPKVNPKDTSVDKDGIPLDPGKRERYHLLVQLREHNLKNPNEYTLNLVEFHNLYYKSPNKQPEGAKAPVAGARRAVSPANTGEFSYQDIHNSSLDSIMRGE